MLRSRLFNQDICSLTRYLPLDWSFRLYGGHVHPDKLSESQARPQYHYPIPPFTDIPTTFWISKCYLNHRISIYQGRFLQSARFCRVRERCLECQPRAESCMRPHGHLIATMGSPLSSTYSTESFTPCPRAHQRVLCARRGHVPNLNARRSDDCSPPHLRPPILFRARRICIPRQ